jgi:hypothetical protein
MFDDLMSGRVLSRVQLLIEKSPKLNLKLIARSGTLASAISGGKVIARQTMLSRSNKPTTHIILSRQTDQLLPLPLEESSMLNATDPHPACMGTPTEGAQRGWPPPPIGG